MEKEKIDKLINELIGSLKDNLSDCLESIILVGSYTVGKISLDRPNVNLLIFVNDNVSADDYLKIGEIFYQVSEKYRDYFGTKIDPLPFRFGIPSGQKESQLVLTPNVLNMKEQEISPPFGIPKNVLKGMAETRKVVFGDDPLASINLDYAREDFLQWAFHDIGILFRNLLTRAPLSYDVRENLDSLAHESLELGKIALYWGIEVFMTEEETGKDKHIELIKNKREIAVFYQKIDKELGKCAKLILEAREKFQEYKDDKNKASQLYNAAYIVTHRIFLKILDEINKS